MNLNLPVDLIAISTNKTSETVKAIEFTKKNINFKNVFLFTSEVINGDFNIIKIHKFKDIVEYNNFTLNLNDYVMSDFALLIQHDGHIVNYRNWDNSFLEFDYIGAPWPLDDNWNKRWDLYPKELSNKIKENLKKNRVGNGGFSLRSKKFLEYASSFERNFIKHGVPEDIYLNIYNYEKALDFGIKYPTVSKALEFSYETPLKGSNLSKVKKYHFFNKHKHLGWHGNKFLNSKKLDNLKFL